MSNPTDRIPVHSMTLREQVALALRIPDSGSQWLDEMIKKARVAEWYGLQYAGLCTSPDPENHQVYSAVDEAQKALGLEPEGEAE